MARLKAAALLLAISVALSGCMTERIIRASDNIEVQYPELLEEARDVRLVLAGEVHNAQWTHRMQLQIIKSLHDDGVPVAIGMEMFQASDQEKLDKWVRGETGLEEFKDFYYASWHMPWSYYGDILLYAREKRIPVVGLNVSRKVIREVFTKGVASLSPEVSKELPSGIACDVDADYENFIREAMGEHSGKHGDDKNFRSFCEAQMVWDTVMAVNALKYLEKNSDRTMVLLAGSGHSWRKGIPAQFEKRSNLSYLVVLPGAAKRLKEETITDDDTDYLWVRTFKFW